MEIVSAAEMREIDRVTTQRFGVRSLTLMENAGTAVADFIRSQNRPAKTIGIICGKGNNGGDGFVVARKLREAGREVQVVLLADPAEVQGDTREMLERLEPRPVMVRSREGLSAERARTAFASALLVDAILGTGFRPPVSGLYAEAIARINAASVPVVAVDIPSGADADQMAAQTGLFTRAHAVVTFTRPRPAHVFGELADGPTVIVPIGSPPEAVSSSLNLNLITPREVLPLIAPRRRDANKGNFGHVLVVGGSLGKAGAAAMAAMAALRVGAGLSTVATAKSVLPTVAAFHAELMTEALAETESGTISLRALEYGRMDALVKGKAVLALGPGISREGETQDFVRTLVARSSLPLLVDADGLNAFEGCSHELYSRRYPLVITPHPGEMARLCGCSVEEILRDRISLARTFAREHQAITVLKGHRTLVADRSAQLWVNTTGNPGMATGGTGDILTGMVAGFMAQNRDRPLEAVLAAVYLHGVAGDIASEKMGEQPMVATDLLAAMPQAFRQVRHAAGDERVVFGETGAQLSAK
ncbi:MAG: NAD(P)H-hydrate dehydratase [Acidobacteria bacterium]|nr:NAD(P)H-hydrate dehydratase [Acidobacteriota bacterium]